MLKCPACKSINTQKREFRYNDKVRLLMQCNGCAHAFDIDYQNSNMGFAHGDYGLIDGEIPRFDRDLKLATTLITSFLIKAGDKILDYGAGWGGLALRISQLSKEYSLGIQVNCFEPVQRLARSIRKMDSTIIVHSDLSTCEDFDFVIAKEVIEHTNNPQSFLTTLSSSMKKGASLLITCPGHSHALESEPGNPIDYQLSNHLHFFTKKSISELVKRTELYELKILALLDQYPNQAKIQYTDQNKSQQILQILSNRVNTEVNHLQVLLRFTGNK